MIEFHEYLFSWIFIKFSVVAFDIMIICKVVFFKMYIIYFNIILTMCTCVYIVYIAYILSILFMFRCYQCQSIRPVWKACILRLRCKRKQRRWGGPTTVFLRLHWSSKTAENWPRFWRYNSFISTESFSFYPGTHNHTVLKKNTQRNSFTEKRLLTWQAFHNACSNIPCQCTHWINMIFLS